MVNANHVFHSLPLLPDLEVKNRSTFGFQFAVFLTQCERRENKCDRHHDCGLKSTLGGRIFIFPWRSSHRNLWVRNGYQIFDVPHSIIMPALVSCRPLTCLGPAIKLSDNVLLSSRCLLPRPLVKVCGPPPGASWRLGRVGFFLNSS
jgi:hypothetical protein